MIDKIYSDLNNYLLRDGDIDSQQNKMDIAVAYLLATPEYALFHPNTIREAIGEMDNEQWVAFCKFIENGDGAGLRKFAAKLAYNARIDRATREAMRILKNG